MSAEATIVHGLIDVSADVCDGPPEVRFHQRPCGIDLHLGCGSASRTTAPSLKVVSG